MQKGVTPRGQTSARVPQCAPSSRESPPGAEARADMLGGGRRRENRCIRGDSARAGAVGCWLLWPFGLCLSVGEMSPGVPGADAGCVLWRCRHVPGLWTVMLQT